MLTPTLMQLPVAQSAGKAGMNNNQNNDVTDASPVDTSFSQTLSKEIAGRNHADEAASETSPPVPGLVPVKKGASPDGKVEHEGKSGEDQKEDSTSATTNLTAETTPADMLALVGSMNLAATPQAVVASAEADASGKELAPGQGIGAGRKTAPGQLSGLEQQRSQGQATPPGLAIAPGQQNASGKTDITESSTGSPAQELAAEQMIAAAQAGVAEPAGNEPVNAAETDAALANAIDSGGKPLKDVSIFGRQDSVRASSTGLAARSANATKNQSSDSETFFARLPTQRGVAAPFAQTAVPVHSGQSSDALNETRADRSQGKNPLSSGITSEIERAEPQTLSQQQVSAALIEGRGEAIKSLSELFKTRSANVDNALTGNSGNFQIAPSAPLMQAGPLSAASPLATGQLAPQVGSPNWDNALGQQVIWMASNQQQTASLTLNPPDLGPLQVELSLSNDQASASFFAAQPEVRQALEAALPRLREMMSDAGIQLGQTTVGTSSQQQQAFNQNGSQAGSTSASGSGRGQDHSEPLSIPLASTIPTRAGRGIVDTFA